MIVEYASGQRAAVALTGHHGRRRVERAGMWREAARPYCEGWERATKVPKVGNQARAGCRQVWFLEA